MLWPPKELGGYSLIIDGIASKHENFDGSGSVWKISFDSEFCIGLLRTLQAMMTRAVLTAKQYKRMEEYGA